MLPSALDDCFAHGDRRLTHAEALALLQSRIVPTKDAERVDLTAVAGRRLATAITADAPVPAHTNAAVDGYAFAYATYDPNTGTAFAVTGRSTAGHPMAAGLAPATAARIFTGGAMPAGSDTVVMQEDCRLDGTTVVIPPGLKGGANVRKAAEDVAVGTVMFEAGHACRPQDLAALASLGLGQVSCFRRLRVGIVASGDEIVPAGAGALSFGQVFDSNSPMLSSLVPLAGANAISLGIWPDDADAIRASLAKAANDFDVILTTGGASRGDEDHMASALGALGSRHFWQLAVKPGRPMMFGQIKRADPAAAPCIVVGLPGNPVAVFVCFLMYVFPLLQRLGGGQWREPRRYKLPATFDFKGRKPGRREFWRGMLVDTPDGLAVDKFARDGSGLISGLRAADGLIDIPEDAGDVAHGDLVDFIPFSEFGIIGA
jgi:molybdopterin molybdotransferase